VVAAIKICGLYDVTPAKFGVSTTVTFRDDNLIEVYNGFDVALDVRLPRGPQHQWRSQTPGAPNKTTADVALNTPQLAFSNTVTTLAGPRPETTAPRSNAYCDGRPPWSADTPVQVVRHDSAALPVLIPVSRTRICPASRITGRSCSPTPKLRRSLNRNLSAGANGTVTVDLIPPMTQFEDRIQQLDLRVRQDVPDRRQAHRNRNSDIYNALNASPILSVNNSYGRRRGARQRRSCRPALEVRLSDDVLTHLET